jgi:outer membrane immunogenic protein
LQLYDISSTHHATTHDIDLQTYIGGQLGGGWGTKQTFDAGEGGGFVDDISDNTSYTVDGFLGGGQLGCNYQFASSPVVIGIEGSWVGTNMKGTGKIDIGADPANPAFNSTIESKIDWIATLTGRIGFTADKALIYVKGGGAWVKDKYTQTEFECEDGDGCDSVAQTLSPTRSGWLFGTGIEYAFLPNWSARLEYNYIDLGTKRVTWSFETDQFNDMDIKQRIHTVTFGVNYKFWGW